MLVSSAFQRGPEKCCDGPASRSPGSAPNIMTRRDAEDTVKHRCKRARAFVADFVGDIGDRLALAEHRDRGHQTDLLAPHGEGHSRFIPESPGEGPSSHSGDL